jgi:hypothetical protein
MRLAADLVTTLFHFIFVPMPIGLALFVAIGQTQHYRTGNEVWGANDPLLGQVHLISIAIGVVTRAESRPPGSRASDASLHATTAPSVRP